MLFDINIFSLLIIFIFEINFASRIKNLVKFRTVTKSSGQHNKYSRILQEDERILKYKMNKDRILGKGQIEIYYTIIYPPRIVQVSIQSRRRNFM